jgi:hypothetical protein
MYARRECKRRSALNVVSGLSACRWSGLLELRGQRWGRCGRLGISLATRHRLLARLESPRPKWGTNIVRNVGHVITCRHSRSRGDVRDVTLGRTIRGQDGFDEPYRWTKVCRRREPSPRRDRASAKVLCGYRQQRLSHCNLVICSLSGFLPLSLAVCCHRGRP